MEFPQKSTHTVYAWKLDIPKITYDEKTLTERQTLRAACSKAEPKNFAPPQTPFPAVQDGQNLISWRWSLPLSTNPVWWGSMHAISSYRGNSPTNTLTYPQTDKQTHRQDWLQDTAPLSLARSAISRRLVFRDSYVSPSRHSACRPMDNSM